MRRADLLTAFSIFVGILAVTGCAPKNSPRVTHDGPKQWTRADAPEDDGVDASELARANVKELANSIKTSDAGAMSVLSSLSRFVLNAKFIQTPALRTAKLSEAITTFNRAFLVQLEKNDGSPEFQKIKSDYYNTVFSGCSRDLRRDCIAADLFAAHPGHTRILTLFALDLDKKIAERIKATGSTSACVERDEACRSHIEERYRLLAMAGHKKATRFDDPKFNFAYMKYANLFAQLIEDAQKCREDERPPECSHRLKAVAERDPSFSSMAFSYLAESHAQIFQTIISRYRPSNYDDPEFVSFVETFNPWAYSQRRAELFQHGANLMLEFATKCCLYQDKARTKIGKSMTDAMSDIQRGSDHFVPTKGLSVQNMVKSIKSEHLLPDATAENPRYDGHEYDLFQNLGIAALVRQIEDSNSSFYDESFFVVDRLFRGHLGRAEVEKVLHNMNRKRAQSLLPGRVVDYVKIYLAYMIVETNRFMAKIYGSETASDQIFEKTVTRSRELTGFWHTIQERVDLVSNMIGSYFKGLNVYDPEFEKAQLALRSVNRTIHYVSVVPNKIVMTYYLSKMNGSRKFTAWWGQVFEIDGSNILKRLFDGNTKDIWFNFAVDSESIDRLTILLGMEYLLSTETLRSFVVRDSADGKRESSQEGSVVSDRVPPVKKGNRAKFFDLVFERYMDDSLSGLRESIANTEVTVLGDPNLAFAKSVCDYEKGNKGKSPPNVEINFLSLGQYTYAGSSEVGDIAPILSRFLTESRKPIAKIRAEIESKRAFLEAMMQVVAHDLRRSEKISSLDQDHEDLSHLREILAELDTLQLRAVKTFLALHEEFYSCYLRLREIERRRANRLYDAERSHLSEIFDQMRPLAGVTDESDLNRRAEEINATYFRDPSRHYRFDRVDGRNYRMSKYDLLMRMKRRIEDSGTFRSSTPQETKAYGGRFPEYDRPRRVSVYVPDGLERSEMVNNGTNLQVFLKGASEQDRADFIHQGMTALNGKADSFVGWWRVLSNDKTLANYGETLLELYLLGETRDTDGTMIGLTAKQLTDSYVNRLAALSLDDLDLENAAEFGREGFFPKSDFQDLLFERDGQTSRPLFQNLMQDAVKMSNVGSKSAGLVNEALKFAKGLNSMQHLIFLPSTVAGESGRPEQQVVQVIVNQAYGRRANDIFQRISNLFEYLAAFDKKKRSDAAQIDERLTRPFYVENGQAYSWYGPRRGGSPLLDKQKIDNTRIILTDFIFETGDLFGTSKKVRSP